MKVMSGEGEPGSLVLSDSIGIAVWIPPDARRYRNFGRGTR